VRRGSAKATGRALAIAVIGAGFAFPLYWMVTMAFKPQDEWNPIKGTIWFPHHPTLENFRNVLGFTNQNTAFFQASSTDASTAILHSVIAAGGGTLLALVVGVFAAYGIARFRAGGAMLPFQILQLRMFPPVAIIIPLLIMLAYLKLFDTYWGLWLVYAAVTFPFVVWLMRSFFQELPREIGEAAIVDGCTQWGAFFKAILPNVKGGLAATALFVFILNWSELLLAMTLTNTEVSTIPITLNKFQSANEGRAYGPQAAIGTIATLPVVVLGFLIQRHLVRGFSFGLLRR